MTRSETVRILLAISLTLAAFGGDARADSVFDRLKHVDRVPEPVAAKTAAEKRMVRRALRAPVRRLIKPSTRARRARRNYIPLRRSLERYLAAAASNGAPDKRIVKAGFVDCVTKGPGRCVAVAGDACRVHKSDEGDCEGMHLVVVVRVAGKRLHLDRIVGGGYYLATNQDDIEDLRDAAP
jgi:hypothetical protein